MRRTLLLAALAALAATSIAPSLGAGADPTVRVAGPAVVARAMATSVVLTLPAEVAAVDGRVLFSGKAVELVGVAPLGGGVGLRAAPFRGGASFGAYDLRPVAGLVRLALVVVPRSTGRLDLRVVIDSAASRSGRRMTIGLDRLTSLAVGASDRHLVAPATGPAPRPVRDAAAPRELVADGRFNARDLDTARLEWLEARERRAACGSRAAAGDANGDGCVDIVDVQAVSALQGSSTAFEKPAVVRTARAAKGRTRRADAIRTFVVTSTADTPDARPGNGVCADAEGRCTLRAAIAEADGIAGDDRIAFALAGTAPVTIRLTGSLPIIASRMGTLIIDGYTQPGASVNTAAVGSNAVPGVEIRGNGNGAREAVIRITSGGNTVRGLIIRDAYRPVIIDGPAAAGNRIVGTWIGVAGLGGASTSKGRWGILLNTGASGNLIGTPDPADRNVIGSTTTAIDLYGPGTNANVIRNNLLCINPDGGPATCNTGVDFNFGPKSNVVGGDDPSERNVIGPTSLEGVELSHGWDPALPWGTDTATTWRIDENRIAGNWIGFRADGSYDAAYRSGLNFSRSDNGVGVNVYDGVNDNLVTRNHIAAVYDGVQIQAPNAQRNIIRGNVIGQSPTGQAAPLSGWGVIVRWNTRFDIIANNVIRNAEKGGIGLLRTTNTGAATGPAANIRITGNVVTDTPGIAIDLFGDGGPETNDPGDADKGANTLLNTPDITYADPAIVRGTGARGATVEVYRATRAAGAYGLPAAFLGQAVVGADGAWRLATSGLVAGDRVTALQVRADGNTSELSRNAPVGSSPTAGTLLASDDFEREVPAWWGPADQGGTWELVGSGFRVSAGAGQVVVPAGERREARLPVETADALVSGRIAIDRLPVGGPVYAYPLVRSSRTDGYRAMIRIAADGAVSVQLKKVVAKVESNLTPEVATGLVAQPGVPLAFRLEAVGTQLRVRVWPAAAAEPPRWHATASDAAIGTAGATGLTAFTGRSVSNGPVTFLLDGFQTRQGS